MLTIGKDPETWLVHRVLERRADGITPATWDREAAGFEVTRDGLARRG